MNITFECSSVKTSVGLRGKVEVMAEGANLNYTLPDKEMLALMDESNIREFMESRGYLVMVKHEDAA